VYYKGNESPCSYQVESDISHAQMMYDGMILWGMFGISLISFARFATSSGLICSQRSFDINGVSGLT
jgi:hypothetical protein